MKTEEILTKIYEAFKHRNAKININLEEIRIPCKSLEEPSTVIVQSDDDKSVLIVYSGNLSDISILRGLHLGRLIKTDKTVYNLIYEKD